MGKKYSYAYKRKRTSPYINRKRRIRKNLMRSGGWLLSKSRKNAPELKWKDSVAHYTANYGDVASLPLFNGIAQGYGASERIGNKITMKKILMRFDIVYTYDSTNYETGNSIRVILVYDRQSNGTTPGLSDVLALTSDASNTTNSPLNLYNKDRFQIIADKIINLQLGVLDPTTPNNTKILKKFQIKRKLNHTVQYSTTGAGWTDIRTGAFMAFFVSDYPNASTKVDVYAYSRLRYIDP